MLWLKMGALDPRSMAECVVVPQMASENAQRVKEPLELQKLGFFLATEVLKPLALDDASLVDGYSGLPQVGSDCPLWGGDQSVVKLSLLGSEGKGP